MINYLFSILNVFTYLFSSASAWLPCNTIGLTIKLVLFLMSLLLYCRIHTYPLSHSSRFTFGSGFHVYTVLNSHLMLWPYDSSFWIPSTRENPALLTCCVTTRSTKRFVPCTACTTIRGQLIASLPRTSRGYALSGWAVKLLNQNTWVTPREKRKRFCPHVSHVYSARYKHTLRHIPPCNKKKKLNLCATRPT